MSRYIPQNFIDKYQEFLSKKELELFLDACQRPLRKSIRVNTLKISVEDFQKKAKKLGWELSQIPWCKAGFWIDREDRSEALGKSPLHLAGYFYIQEASSMLPPEVLGVKEGDLVLDVASAPGSKTTQLAGLMHNTGTVVANEPETSRIKAMASNLERLGVANVIFTQKDGRAFSQYFPNSFDKILLDAPCSGEGTIRKDAQALEYWNDKRVESLATLQWMLIEHAFRALKPGGEMVYSTCTLSPEEDECIVDMLLERFEGNAELIPIDTTFLGDTEVSKKIQKQVLGIGLPGVIRMWPHVFDTEGFFVAKIRKNHPTEDSDFQKNRRNSPYSPLSKKSKNWLQAILKDMFDADFDNFENFYERGNEIWVRPEHAEKIAQMMAFDRSGMHLCERHKNDIRFTHEGALFLIQQGLQPKKGIISLTQEECEQFFQGLDFIKDYEKQYVYFEHNGVIIGIGKSLGNKIKNQLPRYFTVSSK